jgi:hypothetical protein
MVHFRIPRVALRFTRGYIPAAPSGLQRPTTRNFEGNEPLVVYSTRDFGSFHIVAPKELPECSHGWSAADGDAGKAKPVAGRPNQNRPEGAKEIV